MQYTLHLIDGAVLEIDKPQAELLVASDSDDYQMDSNGNVVSNVLAVSTRFSHYQSRAG